MRLRAVDLHGYKSFATRATLQFDAPVTAIVGPNGSGKSNIMDALRWVIGAGSGRTLRAKRAEDVVFSGGRDRAPSGFAEVRAHFDNSDHWLDLDAAEVEATLKLVQRFDPPGVGARNLAECLLLQLEQLAENACWREEAILVVRDHFALLAQRDYGALGQRSGLSRDDLAQAMKLIRSLNPRPGAAIGDARVDYVVPDVIVAKNEGRWSVELNRETVPRVRVNQLYAGLVRRADNSPENQYLKDNLQDAKWFMKNLEYRNETLLRVAAQIVQRQRGFLEHGEEAMQPLVLADIADAVERHESTISRVTTRKYMATPRGVFELKYFFSSHVGTTTGGEVSSTAIRAQIKKLTAEESPRKPLSDNKIATILKQRGIQVARRTVAKYRDELGIPSSNDRRQIF